jgi:hypothetical protein
VARRAPPTGVAHGASRRWVDVYAASEETFFADFAVAFQKLTELGFKQ